MMSPWSRSLTEPRPFDGGRQATATGIVKCPLLGVGLSPASYESVLELCESWIAEARLQHASSRYVALLTVHSVMTGFFDPDYRQALNRATVAAPDGMPLVWALRSFGYRRQPRVYGPDLTLALCDKAARKGYRVYLYGGRDETLDILSGNLRRRFPGLIITGSWSPPFRPLTPEEDDRIVHEINASGADIVFVGIGVPKQERWMRDHQSRLSGAVLLGVGAAFDFHAGRVRQAPSWMQRAGLEWFFRLLMEPRRLWKRYMLNPLFLLLWALESMGVRLVRTDRVERET